MQASARIRQRGGLSGRYRRTCLLKLRTPRTGDVERTSLVLESEAPALSSRIRQWHRWLFESERLGQEGLSGQRRPRLPCEIAHVDHMDRGPRFGKRERRRVDLRWGCKMSLNFKRGFQTSRPTRETLTKPASSVIVDAGSADQHGAHNFRAALRN